MKAPPDILGPARARFPDATAARDYLEKVRWPLGPVCPHCGDVNEGHRITANIPKGVRPGLYFCRAEICKKQFTVTVGTLLENSKLDMQKWVLAIYLIATARRKTSAYELQRVAGIGSYRIASLMFDSIRDALAPLSINAVAQPGKTGDELFNDAVRAVFNLTPLTQSAKGVDPMALDVAKAWTRAGSPDEEMPPEWNKLLNGDEQDAPQPAMAALVDLATVVNAFLDGTATLADLRAAANSEAVIATIKGDIAWMKRAATGRR